VRGAGGGGVARGGRIVERGVRIVVVSVCESEVRDDDTG